MRKSINKVVLAAVLAGVMVISGCGKKSVEYTPDTEAGGQQEGNAISSDDNDISTEDKDVTNSNDSNKEDNNNNAPEEDTIGGIARELNIPSAIDMELDTSGTSLNKIRLSDDSIMRPETDFMYVTNFKNASINSEFKKMICEALFDKEFGVYVSTYDLKLKASEELPLSEIEENAKCGEPAGEYSADTYIGKVDGRLFMIYFTEGEGEIPPAFYGNVVVDDSLSEEEKDKKFITGHIYESSPLIDYNFYTDDLDKEPVVENISSMNIEQAAEKATEYLYNIGIKDSIVENLSALMYCAYNQSGHNVSQEASGYSAELIPAINKIPLYTHEAFGIDTLRSKDILYYMENTKYYVEFTDDGLVTIQGEMPLINDGEKIKAEKLISWDEALVSLQNTVSELYSDYEGFKEVNFNDIRLSYYLIKEDNSYKVVPVYVFAELQKIEATEEMDGVPEYRYDWPVQLILINAIDGISIDIIQDESLINIKG